MKGRTMRRVKLVGVLLSVAMLAACHPDWWPGNPHGDPTPTPTPVPTVVAPTPVPTVVAPTPVPTVVAPTPVPTTAPSSGFVETFDDNAGLDRFDRGVYHRDNFLVARTSWLGDHDLACGPPTTKRLIQRTDPAGSFYVCRDHMMTSVGDTSGYSIAWFQPAQTFASISEVCWSVNLTDLGSRQWWKVAVQSAGTSPLMSHLSAAGLPGLVGPDRVVVSWGSGRAYPGQMQIGNTRLSRDSFDADQDLMTRYPFCLTDNRNGTITLQATGPINGVVQTRTFTVPGQFPAGPLEVTFQDHNYTPLKNDPCCPNNSSLQLFTWHWDGIKVTP